MIARVRAIFILLLTIAVVLALAVYIRRDLVQVETMLKAAGVIGLIAMVFLYALLGASPIPSEPLTVLITAVAGPLAATLVATMGNYLAAMIEYSIGTQMGNIADLDSRREKLPWGLGRFPADSVWFLLLTRSIPGIGPKFVSLISGAYHVKLWRYTWTTLLSNAWGAAFFAYGGYGLLKAAYLIIQNYK